MMNAEEDLNFKIAVLANITSFLPFCGIFKWPNNYNRCKYILNFSLNHNQYWFKLENINAEQSDLYFS